MATVYDDSIAARGYASAPSGVAVIPGGGGIGDSGLLGTLLLLGLLGGNGFNRNSKDCVDQASLNGLQDGLNTNAILAKLASIEAAVPYNEAQVQLALAGLADQLTRTITNGNTALMQGQFNLQLGQANSTSAIQSQLAANTASVLSGLSNVDTNIDRSTCAVINAVRDDGNSTRALITENVIQDLRDDKVILANKLAEERSEARRDRDRHGLEITMIQNQNNQQMQFNDTNNRFNRL